MAAHVIAVLLAAWIIFVFLPLRMWISDFGTWLNTANALARYFIGLPGGLLAAYALRQHTLKRIAPFDVPRIVRALQVAGIDIALYALATGLIVATGKFLPGKLVEYGNVHALPGYSSAAVPGADRADHGGALPSGYWRSSTSKPPARSKK